MEAIRTPPRPGFRLRAAVVVAEYSVVTFAKTFRCLTRGEKKREDYQQHDLELHFPSSGEQHCNLKGSQRMCAAGESLCP